MRRTGGYNTQSSNILERIRTELRTLILNNLNLSLADEQLLLSYSSEPFPDLWRDNIEALKTRWNWIKRSKLALNLAKALQIDKVANIVAAYPGRVRLKKPLDPSQDGPRPNTEHIINNFRNASRKVLKDRKTYHQYEGHCCKGVDCIEVVPYDKYLWLFLDMIKKHPPSKEGYLWLFLDKIQQHPPSEEDHYAQMERLTEKMTLVDKYE